jgi:hypothetical protein
MILINDHIYHINHMDSNANIHAKQGNNDQPYLKTKYIYINWTLNPISSDNPISLIKT